ncbi:glycosyltransferase family 4 protein [Halobacillus yeomjeoni]|uniref:Glycosyltransferase family 4 protein n=1 Tax=Halobacillus yeomjeoni TaxID=311194 RepID=A0A931MVL9_9BACI|nr:glycosyltransferase family 4 protein [Halobacillus yeomjeoni]MBH0230745.1 glycosyltransferase family 4 protein [Halobacillus yeomjeoni]
MSKILILANDNSTIYNFRRELLSRLISENYDVIISVPKHDRNLEFEKLGCKIDEINISRSGKNPLKELALIKSYKKQIKRIKPDLVLTYTAKPNIYGSLACKKLHIPYINNITGLGSNFQTENFIKKIMLFLQKKAYKRSSCVFFQNQSNKKYFEKMNVVGTNTKLLPGSGVNLKLHKFEYYPEESKNIKFILVSRIRKDKGFDEFFSAVKTLTEKFNNIEFHLVGWYEDEKYKEQITDMVHKYPVVYHGSQSQEKVHELISDSHCLIHPSHHEGMANVLLEAAATGRPCITSNIPGCQEAVNDGLTGFLFEVKSSKSLSEAVIKYLELKPEERMKMGLLARNKMETEFDRQIVINSYMEKIENIMGK